MSPQAGSSPHTRGALQLVDFGVVRAGIIPAYAGSTCHCAKRLRRRPDHPRIRGEHMEPNTTDQSEAGSSPHTRGAQGLDKAISRLRRIIPAYAGSTLWWSYSRPSRMDHPRIRGEHTWKSLQYQGSPP